MPTYNIRIYEFDPLFVFSQTIGGTATYSGSQTATGSAVIDDADTFLESNLGGETAFASITVGGTTKNSPVSAEESWTLLDTTTGETFQLVSFVVERGPLAGHYTLSEQPLIPGRTYETLSYASEPDDASGDPVFNYSDYVSDELDGTVSGTDGDDVIDDTYQGDPQAEVVDGGDSLNVTPVDLSADWSAQGVDEQDISAGLSVDTGGIQVDFSLVDESGTATASIESTSTQYVDTGETFGTTSSIEIGSTGLGDAATAIFDFSAIGGSGLLDEVQNVSFRINDIDASGWQDVVEVRAFDADGNPVAVTITIAGDETESGGVVTAGPGSDTSADANGSVLFEIAGPVARIEIDYDNLGTSGQIIYITDLEFQGIPTGADSDVIDAGAGNDSVSAGLDADTVFGGTGADTIDGGVGDDSLYGGDDGDTFVLRDAMGADSIFGGAGGVDQDTVDASALTSGVTVTLTGSEAGTISDGTDTQSFSDIEAVTLTSEADTVDGSASTSDVTIVGGAGEDVITTGSGADLISGDDGNDSITSGAGADSVTGGAGADTITANAGADSVDGGTGTDTIYGGDGADTLDGGADNDSVFGGAGSDVIYGGAGDDVLSGDNGTDTLYGGTGDDTISVGRSDVAEGGDGDDVFLIDDTQNQTGTITITGGEGGETSGDTLNFNGLLDKGTKVITDDDDANGGLTGYAFLLDGTRVEFSEIETIICFARGTRILTNTGERQIEELCEGDQVLTADNGLQTIRWIGSRTVPAQGDLAPIVIGKGVLGNLRDLVVSPLHRMVIGGPTAELLFGEAEVLVPARHLLNRDGVWRLEGGEVEYFHMLFDSHQIVYAEGALSESFHPGERALDAVTEEARAEILTLFPELDGCPAAYGPAARTALRGFEADVLGGQH